MWDFLLIAECEFHYLKKKKKANNPLKGNNAFNERFLSSGLFFLTVSPSSQLPPKLFIMLAALCYSPSYYISVLADQILLGFAVLLNLFFRFEPSQEIAAILGELPLLKSGFMYVVIKINKYLVAVEKMMFLCVNTQQSAFGLSIR